MERILYRCTNHGITAIATSAVYEAIQSDFAEHDLTAYFPPRDYPKPIFTFSANLHKHDRWKYLTGDLAEMDRLLKGFTVTEAAFYVPFSNDFQNSVSKASKIERGFRTSLTDLFDNFDIALHAQLERLLSIGASAAGRFRE